MSQRKMNNDTTQNNSLVVKLLSILFIVFAIICIFSAFASDTKILLVSALGFLALTATLNFAHKFNVNKHNAKAFYIICVLLDVISIPLAFIYLIFSYVLLVPAIIFSKKLVSCNSKNKLGLLLFIASILITVFCFVKSLIAVF